MKKTMSWLTLPGRLSNWIHETIEDSFEMAPYHLKLYSRGLGSGAGGVVSDFARREMLIYQWIANDRAYLGKHHPECGRHWVMLGDLYASEYWPAAGMTYYERGLRIYRMSLPEHDRRVLEVKGKIAASMKASGKLDEALVLIAEIAQARLDSDSPLFERLDALAAWRDILEAQEGYREAGEVQRRIVAILEAEVLPGLLSRRSDELVEPYRKLGRLYSLCSAPDASVFTGLADGLETLKMLKKACGFESMTLRPDLERLRSLYLRRGMLDPAGYFKDWLSVIELVRKVSGVEYRGIERDLEELASHYEKRDEPGDRTVAHRYRRRAEQIAHRNRKTDR